MDPDTSQDAGEETALPGKVRAFLNEEGQQVDLNGLHAAKNAIRQEDDSADEASEVPPGRLGWLMDFLAEDDLEEEHEGDAEPAAEAPAPEGPPEETSSNDYLSDPVLQALLEAGIVEQSNVMYAVRRHARAPEGPVWRLLLNLPDVNAEAVRAMAARVHGIETVTLVNEDVIAEVAASLQEHLTAGERRALRAHRLLPLMLQADQEEPHLEVAAADPLDPDLQAFVRAFRLSATVRYAPSSVIAAHLDQALQAPSASPPETSREADEDRSAPETTTLPEEGSEEDDAAFVSGDAYEAELDAFDPDQVGATPAEDLTEEETPEQEDDIDFTSVELSTLVEEVAEEEDASESRSIKQELAALRARLFAKEQEDVPADADPEEAPAAPEAGGEQDAPLQLSVTPDVADERAGDDAPSGPGAADEEHGPPAAATTDEEAAPDILEDTPADAEAAFHSETFAEQSSDERIDTKQAVSDASVSESELDADELARALNTESLPDEDVLIEHDSGTGSGDDAPPRDDESGFDGSPIDLHDTTPVPDVADWTNRSDATDAPPADEEGVADTSASSDDAKDDPVLEEIKRKDRVIAMLLRKEIVKPKAIKRAQAKKEQDRIKDSLWRVLARVKGVDREAIFREAARLYAFPIAEIGEGKPDPEFARSVTDTFDEQYRDQLLELLVVPFEVDLEQQTGAIKVVFITHDPTRPEVHRMMQKLKLERFELRYAPETVVASLIAEAFPRKNEYLERLSEDMALDLGMSYQAEEGAELVDEDALEAEISRSKLINLFEATLIEAVRLGASDIHIWPNADKQVEIHFRIDGRLSRWHVEDKVHPEALISVIKDNAMKVDRFEREAAQDGFIQRWIDEALIRFRVSVMPIANAATDVRSESIVIRVLDDRKVVKDLSLLGLNDLALERFEKAIRQPHGMVILTGPTGSGKTTTLYAALHEVISPEVNVLTVEDPVEYIINGVRQIKLNNKLELEGALRSILRHDPDVVMVGEMRDRPTAELAIKLANTGHLTFSTLHTNDAASAISRLYKMGIEPFLIAYAINLVVAQRLIRKLCSECKRVNEDPDPVLLKNLGFTEADLESIERGELVLYKEGEEEECPQCRGLGYKGRRAVAEALYFSRRIRHLVADAAEEKLDEMTVKEVARSEGMLTLQDSARAVVKAGESSVREMMRVIATED